MAAFINFFKSDKGKSESISKTSPKPSSPKPSSKKPGSAVTSKTATKTASKPAPTTESKQDTSPKSVAASPSSLDIQSKPNIRIQSAIAQTKDDSEGLEDIENVKKKLNLLLQDIENREPEKDFKGEDSVMRQDVELDLFPNSDRSMKISRQCYLNLVSDTVIYSGMQCHQDVWQKFSKDLKSEEKSDKAKKFVNEIIQETNRVLSTTKEYNKAYKFIYGIRYLLFNQNFGEILKDVSAPNRKSIIEKVKASTEALYENYTTALKRAHRLPLNEDRNIRRVTAQDLYQVTNLFSFYTDLQQHDLQHQKTDIKELDQHYQELENLLQSNQQLFQELLTEIQRQYSKADAEIIGDNASQLLKRTKSAMQLLNRDKAQLTFVQEHMSNRITDMHKASVFDKIGELSPKELSPKELSPKELNPKSLSASESLVGGTKGRTSRRQYAIPVVSPKFSRNRHYQTLQAKDELSDVPEEMGQSGGAIANLREVIQNLTDIHSMAKDLSHEYRAIAKRQTDNNMRYREFLDRLHFLQNNQSVN